MEEKAFLTSDDIDRIRQKKAKGYARLRHRLLLVELLIGGVYLLAFLLGLSLPLKDSILRIISHPFLVVALYFLIFAVGYGLLSLPLEYYSGYLLPHRYDLSTQTRKGWLLDQLKGAILGLLFGTLVLEVVYYLLRLSPSFWWLWAGLLMLFLTVLLNNLAPTLIIPLFFKLTPVSDEEIVSRLTDLFQREGTKVRGVYTINLSSKTKVANAALIGLGNTRRLVLGDTLYRDYNLDEVETILAHELGHHLHRDIPWGIALQSAVILLGFYLAHLISGWGARAPSDIAAFPLLALAVGGIGVLATPLSNAFSRSREWAADRYALEATRKPKAFTSAMVKLANQNLADVEPEPWVEFLLYSHPAIGKRIKQGQDFERAMALDKLPPGGYSRRGNYQKYLSPNPLQRYLISRFHQRVEELVKETGASHLLDVGCGEGFTIERLKVNKIEVQGVDNDLPSLIEAKEKNPDLPFYLADIYNLPFASDSFPLLLCLEVLEHLPDPHSGLMELRRVTSSWSLISVPHEPFFMLANFLRGKNLRNWGNDPEHLHNWRAKRFVRLLEGYFSVEKVVYSFPWILALCRKR